MVEIKFILRSRGPAQTQVTLAADLSVDLSFFSVFSPDFQFPFSLSLLQPNILLSVLSKSSDFILLHTPELLLPPINGLHKHRMLPDVGFNRLHCPMPCVRTIDSFTKFFVHVGHPLAVEYLAYQKIQLGKGPPLSLQNLGRRRQRVTKKTMGKVTLIVQLTNKIIPAHLSNKHIGIRLTPSNPPQLKRICPPTISSENGGNSRRKA